VEIVVTQNGVAVARIVPEAARAHSTGGGRKPTAEHEAALARTEERLRAGFPLRIGKIDREEPYASARPWIEKYLKEQGVVAAFDGPPALRFTAC
jgi:antitoxin (DNA-binding transcriptional repressor) of toxin-antitoxin stability system